MDGQLKNVKTHARLLSKSTWYDWRMTLLGTLKEGLFRSAEGMIQDEEKLDEQQALIEAVLPQLIRQAEDLQQEESDYQLAAEELANCDPEELSNARQRLITVDADVAAKKQLIADLQKQLQGKETEIEAGTERKQVCLEHIREAEKVREECRGWTSTEIGVLKGTSPSPCFCEIKLTFPRQSKRDRKCTWLDYYWSIRHHNFNDIPKGN